MPKKKDYCKNCKWFFRLKKTTSSSTYTKIEKYCDPNRTVIQGLSDVDFNLEKLFNCKEHNANNDCFYYKRKWWKF